MWLQGWLLVCLVLMNMHVMAQPSVVLDVGHTPINTGAKGAHGMTEYQYNYNMVKAIKRQLVAEAIVDVQTVSIDEPNIRLAERATRYPNSDLFLSIHHDAFPEILKPQLNQLTGFSVFVSRKNPHYKQSLACAVTLAKQLKAIGRQPSVYHGWDIEGERKTLLHRDGVYQYDNLVVLKSAAMPAILLEVGVIAHPEEAKTLANPQQIEKNAQAIAQGIQSCLSSQHNNLKRT